MASVAALALLLSVSLAASLGGARGAWTDTASLVNVRTGHTATALLDGRVLVAGGFGGPPTGARACLNSAEVYDPVSARWNATAPMNFARCFHAATLLDDGTGRVIVTGGTGANGSALASIEFFDPATLTWASAPRDDMRTPRAYHQSALLSRGDILVIGGYNGQSGYLASVEQYRVDLPTSPWNPVGALSVGRANFTATRLPNDRILVAGGRIAPDTDTNTAEFCSNLVYCTWLATANAMDVARSAHTATLLANNDVLIAGGFSGGSNPTAGAEVYDNSRFGNTLTEMVAARALHQTVLPLLPSCR